MKNRETGERLKSCTMIITEPNEFVVEIHDRMPVFLTSEQFAPWLSGEAGAEVLKATPNDYLQRCQCRSASVARRRTRMMRR